MRLRYERAENRREAALDNPPTGARKLTPGNGVGDASIGNRPSMLAVFTRHRRGDIRTARWPASAMSGVDRRQEPHGQSLGGGNVEHKRADSSAPPAPARSNGAQSVSIFISLA